MKKNPLLFFMIFAIVLCFCSCSSQDSNNTVTVPDIVNTEVDDAKSVISNIGLIPKIVYESNEDIQKDCVISCSPSFGKNISKGSKVTIHVSKGPSLLTSKSSYAHWTFIKHGVKDDWEFHNPYIKDGYLYIDCHNVVFGYSMEWRDRYNEGHASGTACLNDTFDKTVPVEVEYSERNVQANQSQSFLIKVPLNELETNLPTNMFFNVGIKVDGTDTDLLFDFSMTW